MKIIYKKSRSIRHLIFGVVFTLFSLLTFWNKEEIKWSNLGFTAIGILFFLLGALTYKKIYIEFEGNTLRVNGLRKKEINLTQIESFQNLGGEYKITAQGKTIRINTQLIEDSSLHQLNSKLKEYELKWKGK